MTRQNISIGAAANDGTGETLRSAGSKINSNFIELFQKLGGDSDVLSAGITLTSNSVVFEGASADSFETTLLVTDPTSDRTVTIPNANGTITLDTATSTLTNKTLTSPVITTPQINDTSANHQYVFAVSELSADRTVTLPLLSSNDTFAFTGFAQTLTNKTLTSPVINTGKYGTSLNDTNGNELIKVTATSSAVNEVTLSNAATGNSPTIIASGGDTNINMTVGGKGTGSVVLNKHAITSATMTANGAASTTVGYIICNKGSALSVSLADGTTVGESKTFTNKGAGVATVTPASFAQGSTFALAQYDGATVIWDGTNWYLVGNQSSVTVS